LPSTLAHKVEKRHLAALAALWSAAEISDLGGREKMDVASDVSAGDGSVVDEDVMVGLTL
jgi:hypothetical protein